MNVRIKLFAAAKELAGTDVLPVALAPNATIADVRKQLIKTTPALERIIAHSLWAVGAEYVPDTTPITEHSDIALIPPVSGG
jgi:molybdopterin converting factor small subunit